jgi:CheY-like chemotaxis protein
MDIFMPVMDGLEATRRIRQYYLKEDEPVIIALTANALIEEKENGIQAGMNDFITKPYKPKDIQQIIIKWGEKIQAPSL